LHVIVDRLVVVDVVESLEIYVGVGDIELGTCIELSVVEKSVIIEIFGFGFSL
jgi:hypothetical protein